MATVQDGPASASARTSDGLMSAVVNLHGYDEAGVHRALGANPFGPHSATPYLTVSHPVNLSSLCTRCCWLVT
jgi:hypothetical protein